MAWKMSHPRRRESSKDATTVDVAFSTGTTKAAAQFRGSGSAARARVWPSMDADHCVVDVTPNHRTREPGSTSTASGSAPSRYGSVPMSPG